MNIYSFLYFVLVFICFDLTAQLPFKNYTNFYDLQQEFYNKTDIANSKKKLLKITQLANKKETNREQQLGELMKFERMKYFLEPRTYPTGNFFEPTIAWDNWNDYLSNTYKKNASALFNGNWTSLNPDSVSEDGSVGSGRVNVVRFHPNNPNIIFVATAGGGLWKSTDAANSWAPLTDNIGAMGISDLAINPQNPNIMYIATGDGEAYFSTTAPAFYSVGILKTTDGGVSWSSTGLSWNLSQTLRTTRILINPLNPEIILVAASAGIYRTTDGGENWINASGLQGSGIIKDMEFKPDDPNIVYASSFYQFYKSSDGGISFTVIESAAISPNIVYSTDIAVTADEPNYVYLICGNRNTFGFYGLFRSVDAGNSFEFRSAAPNILGYNLDGSGTSGLAPYAISLVVSPTNKDELIAGGINMWKSTNGGQSWSVLTDWTRTQAPNNSNKPYVHADIHEIVYSPNNTGKIYAATDGGLFVTEGIDLTWKDKSSGMQVGQIYRFGLSALNKNNMILGLQDNGSILNKYGTSYKNFVYGDGMDCFIDWSDENFLYSSFEYGALVKSTNGGLTGDYIVSNITEYQQGYGAWVTPWAINNTNSQTLYAGYANLWKSTNRGSSWTKLGNLPTSQGSVSIIDFRVSPSDPNIIYVIKPGKVYKTTNGGNNWVDISASLPNNFAFPISIEVHNTNPDKVWVGFSGYLASAKVYQSVDGGTSWTNISDGLPNLPINKIIYQKGTDDVIYVGADIGVYYYDESWKMFSSGLPNTMVTDMEIHYDSKKLRASTFGRGIWESDLYDAVPSQTNDKIELSVFPNPAQGYFMLAFNNINEDNYLIELRSTTGQLVYRENLLNYSGAYSQKIEVPNLAKGIYIFSVENASTKLFKKSVLY